MRQLFAILVLALAAATTARAGDTAEHRIIGFSPDGGVFAFEEFGIQDGSGFPYSTIFFIETETDSWLPRTPIRVLEQEDRGDLEEIRAKAATQAEAIIREHRITDNWMDLAHSPLGEFAASPIRQPFAVPRPHDALAEPEDRYEALLDLYHAETPSDLNCVLVIGDRPSGFRLSLGRPDGGEPVVIHQDQELPRSRGCPITYRLSRVVAMRTYPVERVIVIISNIRKGFEGADRRFIAIPAMLPE